MTVDRTDEYVELFGGEDPDEDFGDPIPLTKKVQIPAFPIASLPPAIADMVGGVAHATQTDPAMAGTSALVVLAASVCGHAIIEVRPGWREPLGIYTATVAGPGERKSAVQNCMAAPLFRVERELAKKFAAQREETLTIKFVAEKAAEQAKGAAVKASRDGDKDKADRALADAMGSVQLAADIQIPAIPRLIADDVTPEAAGSLLAEQGGRLAIISAEGGLFDIVAGRYTGNVPNMDLWLKGHSGDPVKVDRKGREPEYIERPTLTLGLMIQPSVLTTIASNRHFRGRGLLARFLYATPVSKVGRRMIAAEPVSEVVASRYATVVADLAEKMHGWGDDPAVLTLTAAAHEAVKSIEAAVEPTLAGDGELAHLADWGSKYVGAVARIAGILHLGTLGADKGTTTPVSAETILAANRIGEYFKAAAIKAFSVMGTDPITADAMYLLDRILGTGDEEMSERDMFNLSRSRFKQTASMAPALARLIEHGFLLPLPVSPPSGRGRPASPRFTVHPLAAQTAEIAQIPDS